MKDTTQNTKIQTLIDKLNTEKITWIDYLTTPKRIDDKKEIFIVITFPFKSELEADDSYLKQHKSLSLTAVNFSKQENRHTEKQTIKIWDLPYTMDKFKIKKIIEAKYGPVEYFNSRTAGSQLVCFTRFTNPDIHKYIMNQGTMLIGKKVARVTHTNILLYQFLQKIKTKPAVHITDLPNKITPRKLLTELKHYKVISVFVPIHRNGF